MLRSALEAPPGLKASPSWQAPPGKPLQASHARHSQREQCRKTFPAIAWRAVLPGGHCWRGLPGWPYYLALFILTFRKKLPTPPHRAPAKRTRRTPNIPMSIGLTHLHIHRVGRSWIPAHVRDLENGPHRPRAVLLASSKQAAAAATPSKVRKSAFCS